MNPPLPNEMRAWIWDAKGDPRGLRLDKLPVPPPAAGEVLVANRAVGLNPVDWKLVEGGYPAWKPGQIPGVDGAGEVEAVGDGVRLPLGLRVAYHQSLKRQGSFADFACVDAKALMPIPPGVHDVAAAALPCPGMTAAQALRKVPFQPNRDVLVIGAGGAVAFLIAQLAVGAGWRVWVTAASVHRERLLATGIAGVFDYKDPDWRAGLTRVLGSRRLHAIFDTVSGEHARSLFELIGYNGHVVCIQDRIEENPLPPFTRAASLHEVALNSIYDYADDEDWRQWRTAARELFGKLVSGVLRPSEIDTLTFDEIPAALAAMKSGERRGKLVATL